MPKNSKKGFVGLIIMLVVSLMFAQVMFGVDVIGYLRSAEKTNGVLGYLIRFAILIWDKFLIAPVTFIFDVVKSVVLFIYHLMTGWVDQNSASIPK